MRGSVSRGDPAELPAGDVPVLFVHGQPGLGSDFEPVKERLGQRFAVLSPDRPGYGSSLIPAVSMHENVEMLAALAEEKIAGPAIVVGHSFGGGIAVLLAARRPDLVAGLVLDDVLFAGRRDIKQLHPA